MSHVTKVHLHRTINETWAVVQRVRMTADQLLSLGYADATAAAAAIESATAQLVVGVAPVVTVDATITAVVDIDALTVTFVIPPPTSLTDTVQEHDQYLVFEPGSATSERRIWEGKWTVEAAPEAV